MPSSPEALDLQTIFGRALLLEQIACKVAKNHQILRCTIGIVEQLRKMGIMCVTR